MNITQIKRDIDNGVMVCSSTWRELVEWAVKAEKKAGDYRNDPNVQGMADCMDMVRQELIEAGFVPANAAPMFIANFVASHIAERNADLVKGLQWIVDNPGAHPDNVQSVARACLKVHGEKV